VATKNVKNEIKDILKKEYSFYMSDFPLQKKNFRKVILVRWFKTEKLGLAYK
jgi:hypothetical protein